MKKRVVAWIRYLLFTIAMIIIYLFNNHIVTLILLVMVLLLPFMSYCLLRFSVGKLSVSLRFPQSVVERNEASSVIIRVENKSMIPQSNLHVVFTLKNLFVTNDYEHEHFFFVGAKTVEEFSVPIRFVICGCYQLRAECIDTFDLLGAMKRPIPICEMKEIICMPQKISLGEGFDEIFGNSEEDEIYEVQNLGDDNSEIIDIRQYRPGDRLQSIHWKLSAKQQETMIKEFASLSGDMYQVLIENQYDAKQMDAFFDALYSLLLTLCKRNILFSACWLSSNGTNMRREEVKSIEDVENIVVKLFYEKPSKDKSYSFDSYMSQSTKKNYMLVTTKQHKDDEYKQLYNNKNVARIYQIILK